MLLWLVAKQMTIAYDILFKSIYKELLNDNNTTKSEYYIDGIHLSFKALKLLENLCFWIEAYSRIMHHI